MTMLLKTEMPTPRRPKSPSSKMEKSPKEQNNLEQGFPPYFGARQHFYGSETSMHLYQVFKIPNRG